MLKSKIITLIKFSSLAGCFFLAGCLSLSGCSGKGLKLVHSTAFTDGNAYVGVMTSENKGIVTGEKGLVLCSEDGGQTWTKDKIIAPFIAGMYVVNENVVYMNGDTRVFMKTTDGGKTKEILPKTSFAIGKGVNMLDVKGRLFETSDYGKNWTKNGEMFTEENIKPVVKNLLTMNSIWQDETGIRLAYLGKKDGTEYHFVMKLSTNGGKTFTKEFDYVLKKEPKSFTVNQRNEICVMNQDTTMNVYRY